MNRPSINGQIRAGFLIGLATMAVSLGASLRLATSGTEANRAGPTSPPPPRITAEAGARRAAAAIAIGITLSILAVSGAAIGVYREIRNRDRREKALRDSERMLRATVDSLEQRTAVLDEAGRVLAGTRVLPADTGCGGGPGVGVAFVPDCEVLRDDPTPQARAVWAGIHAVIDGSQREFQLEYPCSDGSDARWFLMRVARVEDEDAAPDRVVVSNEEITERVRVAESVRQSEERCRAVVASVEDIIFVLDREQRYIGVYGRWLERERLSPETFIGRSIPEVLPAEAARIHVAASRRVLDGEHVVFDWTRRGAGGERHVQVSLSPLRDVAGAIDGVVGVGRDITDRIRAEREIHRRDAILQAVGFASERFLRVANWEDSIQEVLAHLGEASHACRTYLFENQTDTDGRSVALLRHEWAAPGTQRMASTTESRSIALDDPAFERWAGLLSAGESVCGQLADLAEAERAFLVGRGVHSVILVPIFVGEQWVGFLGFDDCVTGRDWSTVEAEALRAAADTLGAAMHRRRVEEALRHSEEQLQQSQKMEAVGRLAGGIAHDFNNLLTAIQGRTELLLSEDWGDRRIESDLAEIRAAADRAATLTRQLLAFSRRQVLQPKVLNLNHVVADMERMMRRLIGEDIVLMTVLAPDLGAVRADPNHIEQVLLNLLVNARDAMPEGGGITIRTSNAKIDARTSWPSGVEPGSYVMLQVSDTGTGVPPELYERIFEPFFTTKEPGKGTGLGLSMVYGIVKQSGGAITVDSSVGNGTTFRILLPRVEAEPESVSRTATAAQPVSPGHETVLLVEDEVAVRTLVRRVLERKGYTVLEASNGAEAIQIADAHPTPIDLLLTDVVMPGMGGAKLVENLAPRHPAMHVLLMSGYTDQEILRRGALEFRAGFISKPFSPDQLVRKVREILDSGVAPAGGTVAAAPVSGTD